jgi:hypothetical protein
MGFLARSRSSIFVLSLLTTPITVLGDDLGLDAVDDFFATCLRLTDSSVHGALEVSGAGCELCKHFAQIFVGV